MHSLQCGLIVRRRQNNIFPANWDSPDWLFQKRLPSWLLFRHHYLCGWPPAVDFFPSADRSMCLSFPGGQIFSCGKIHSVSCPTRSQWGSRGGQSSIHTSIVHRVDAWGEAVLILSFCRLISRCSFRYQRVHRPLHRSPWVRCFQWLRSQFLTYGSGVAGWLFHFWPVLLYSCCLSHQRISELSDF